MKIKDLWALYEKDHLPHTRSGWRAVIAWKHLAPSFGKLKPEQITPAIVEKYCGSRDVGGATVNRELTTLSAIIGYGRKTGLTTAAPFIRKRSGSVPRSRILSEDEIAKLLEACLDNPSLLLFVQIALLTGQRRAAIIGLKWSQVDWRSMIVDFNDRSATNASRMKGRGVIPIADELQGILSHVCHPGGDGKRYVIEGFAGDNPQLDRPFRETCDRIGLTDVTPHTLRHTVATRLISRGVPLLPVSRLLGHKSVLTTERTYMHLTPDFISEAVNNLTIKKES